MSKIDTVRVQAEEAVGFHRTSIKQMEERTVEQKMDSTSTEDYKTQISRILISTNKLVTCFLM